MDDVFTFLVEWHPQYFSPYKVEWLYSNKKYVPVQFVQILEI
jgi:hypothetical protein